MNTSDNYDDWTLEQKTKTLEIAVNFLTNASVNGNLQEVKDLYTMIVQKFDTTVDTREGRRLKHSPLELAAEKGHHEIVDYLIPLSVFDYKNEALNKAAKKGHILCAQALIPHCPPEQLSDAMLNAVFTKHWAVADMLLALDPPHSVNNEYELCLIWSSVHRNPQFLSEFYTRCNPERAMERIKEAEERGNGWSEDEIRMLVDYHSPEGQRQRLVQHVDLAEKHSARKAKI